MRLLQTFSFDGFAREYAAKFSNDQDFISANVADTMLFAYPVLRVCTAAEQIQQTVNKCYDNSLLYVQTDQMVDVHSYMMNAVALVNQQIPVIKQIGTGAAKILEQIFGSAPATGPTTNAFYNYVVHLQEKESVKPKAKKIVAVQVRRQESFEEIMKPKTHKKKGVWW